MHRTDFFQELKTTLPFVAILRGITPAEAEAVAHMLVETGFRFLEVPLNSPDPLKTLRIMTQAVGGDAWVGAGTVVTVEQAQQVADAGGRLIVAPNTDPNIIGFAARYGMVTMPGIATPTDAFTALTAGATALKLFPAEIVTPAVLKAMRAILPVDVACLPVGGIQPDAEQMLQYLHAGANGFGLGTGLYRPGLSIEDIRDRAVRYRQAWELAKQSQR